MKMEKEKVREGDSVMTLAAKSDMLVVNVSFFLRAEVMGDVAMVTNTFSLA